MENIYDTIQKDEQKQGEEKRNIFIAEKVRQVLKSKMLIKQKILAREKDSDAITFTEFIKKLDKIVRRLESMERENPERSEVEDEYYGFLDKYADKVVLKDYEIDQLLSYVKTSIMRCGIPRNQEEYTSTDLVKYALLILEDFINEYYGEKDQELGKWIDFICSSSNAGFYDKTSEIYRIKGYGRDYFTISDYHKKIFSIDIDGNVNLNKDVDFDNALFRDDLYIGTINLNNKRVLTILSSREGNLDPIFFGYKCVNYTEELDMRIKLDAKAIIPLPLALKYCGMSQFTEPLYDKLMLETVAITMNEKNSLTSDYPLSTYNITLSDGEIPAKELYVYKSKVGTSWRSGIMRKKDNQNSDIEPIANLNEILELIGLSYLIEDSYDPKKLEYIMLAIREDGKIPTIITSEETPAISLQK